MFFVVEIDNDGFKVYDSAGNLIDPAKDASVTALGTLLTSIKNTDGIKKIVDALPAGTNNIGDVDVLSSALPTGASTEATLLLIKAKTDNIPSDPARESGKLISLETLLTAIKSTDGVKKITDPLPAGTNNIGDVDLASAIPAGTNEIGKVAQGTKAANNAAWPQYLVDASGNVIAVLNDSGTYRLQVEAKLAAGGASQPVKVVDGEGDEVSVEDETNWSAAQSGFVVLGKDAVTVPAKLRDLACDQLGRLITAPSGALSYLSGLAAGQVTLSAATVVPLRSTAYTEQTSNAQRSLVSASANDTAAGTGARTVRITYYTSAMVGPYTEDVTLNGTTPVNTVATDICFIERMDVLTAGAGASIPAGIVSLKAAVAGGGATIWSIAVGEGKTFGAHHYVQTTKTCYITGMSGGIKGADTSGFHLRSQDLTTPATPGLDRQLNEVLRAPSSGNTPIRTYGTPIKVTGPARITMMVMPDSTSSRVYYGAFDFYEQ